MQACNQTEPPTRNYEEELEAQFAITKNTKKCYDEAIAQLDELWEQAAEREADLKRLLDERTTKLQGMEKEVAVLQAANTDATQRLAKEEEKREQTVIQHFEETESLRSQNRELQIMAHQHLAMWKHTEEQKAILSSSYNHLTVESTLDIKRQ